MRGRLPRMALAIVLPAARFQLGRRRCTALRAGLQQEGDDRGVAVLAGDSKHVFTLQRFATIVDNRKRAVCAFTLRSNAMRNMGVTGLCLAVLLGLVLAFNLPAKEKAPKMSNVQGSVQMINRDTSTITVHKGNVKKDVVYSGDTKFMSGHSNDKKPGSVDQVKEGNFISCAGTYNGVKLMAKECVYRESK
jgi:hypothetical protein